MKTKRIRLFVLALAPACLALAGCGSSSGTKALTVCIASAPGTIDPSLNTTVDGGTYDEHLFEGLYRWSYEGTSPNGKSVLVPGIVKDAPVSSIDSTTKEETLTYTLRSGLKFSDGTALTAGDMVRSWKRAVSSTTASDYAYLFEAVKGGAKAEGEADGASLAVSAPNDTTFVVTLVNHVTYWNELTAFPTFAPVPTSADSKGEWCVSGSDAASRIIGNGPMKVKVFDETKIELVPNENYYNPDIVKCKDLVFAFSDDDSAMLTSYQAGSYDFIDSFPNDQIESLKKSLPNEYFNVGQLGTYYTCWNIHAKAFDAKLDTEAKKIKFRHAIALLIDRQYLVDNVAKGGQKPAAGFVSQGLTDADGASDWTAHNGPAQDGSGWYKTDSASMDSNVAEAVALLKEVGYSYDETSKKFTDIPQFEYLYNTNSGHKAIAEYLQQNLAKYGISIKLANQDWATFVATRKAGGYTYTRNGWLCDYNDPISMLDMWVSGSGNNDCGFGKDADYKVAAGKAIYEVDMNADGTIAAEEKNLTWADSYDKIIDKIKTTTDTALRFKLMHAAETLLMSTWAVAPLYYYTDLFLKKTTLTGFFAMPLGYKFFYGVDTSASK